MIFRAPAFFWTERNTLSAHILSPFGALLGAVTAARMKTRGWRASVPVICVGNPVAGGAGKTPTALELGRLLKTIGRNPVFLTRGYGGRLRGPVTVDAARHSAAEVGDEALLLAECAPTVMARDRVSGAALAADCGADVIIMDDGFQNPSLDKDLSLLVIDAAVGVGNGMCLPAGPLRAPLTAQLAKADGVVLIGQGSPGERIAAQTAALGKPVLRAALKPDPMAIARLGGKALLAFAGIGRPEKFAATLQALGAAVRLRAYPDHYFYTEDDAEALLMEAERDGLILVTTEKDLARMRGGPAEYDHKSWFPLFAPAKKQERTRARIRALAELRRKSDVLPVRLAFEDSAGVVGLVQRIWKQD